MCVWLGWYGAEFFAAWHDLADASRTGVRARHSLAHAVAIECADSQLFPVIVLGTCVACC
jgi:hypothetical protein